MTTLVGDFPTIDTDWQMPVMRAEGQVVKAMGEDLTWYVWTGHAEQLLITSVCWLCETPQAKQCNSDYVESWRGPDNLTGIGAYWWCERCDVGWAEVP